MNRASHHHHQHEKPDYNRAFMVGVALNVIFVVIEVFYEHGDEDHACMQSNHCAE
jgi:Co/Zn/Cd efflux system component